MAKISAKEEYFLKLMNSLVELYSVDPSLLERRSSLITRHLSLFLSPEKIFRALASILEKEEDLEFASVMIQTLNIILLTSSELHEMRTNLKDLLNDTSRDLFTVLYRSWCHNPAATFSLCLLAQAYEHSAALVCKLYACSLAHSLVHWLAWFSRTFIHAMQPHVVPNSRLPCSSLSRSTSSYNCSNHQSSPAYECSCSSPSAIPSSSRAFMVS